MIALKLTKPGAKSFFDLGVRCKPRSDTTRNIITTFESMLAAQFLTHRKRHLMTLRHQNKTPSVMSATCNHLEIWSATLDIRKMQVNIFVVQGMSYM